MFLVDAAICELLPDRRAAAGNGPVLRDEETGRGIYIEKKRKAVCVCACVCGNM